MSGLWLTEPQIGLVAALLIILAGPAAGSCAALLAERLPRAEPVGRARSRCRSCGGAIAARDLVPLWSYARLGGRCRACGAPIPARLWQAEWAGLGLGLAAAGLGQGTGDAVAGAVWLWLLLALALADLRAFRLPDPLTAALAMAGVAVAWPDVPGAALGAALGAGAFLALRLGYRALAGRQGMGLGDVKLMAGIGAGLGAPALPWVALIAALSALALAGARARRRRRPLRRLGAVPFGAYLAAAAAAVWIAQRL